MMINQFPELWQNILDEEFQKSYFKTLEVFLESEYAKQTCYPPKAKIFAAFQYCSPSQLKVVIIGQDPYHGPGQANGLSFSVNPGIKHPPSLINIFKELQNDISAPYPESGDLSPWAKQGVLLLNATLTVRQGEAGSHQKNGWEQFTDAVIQHISDQQSGVVFMLWGGYAKKKGAKIDRTKHLVLETGHPSPLSANRGLWFENHHFSKCNSYLKSNNTEPINWLLEQSQCLLFT